MADFKIKSTAGTGNKTLIQSQDQSGSSYAIQVGDAGATTLTNVTAGTIGSGVTFPAGHVIQTVVAKKTDENSAAHSGQTFTKVLDGSGNAEWRATIDNVTDGNDVIVCASFAARLGINPDQSGGQYGFLRDTGTASNSGGTAIYQFPSHHAWYFDIRAYKFDSEVFTVSTDDGDRAITYRRVAADPSYVCLTFFS